MEIEIPGNRNGIEIYFLEKKNVISGPYNNCKFTVSMG